MKQPMWDQNLTTLTQGYMVNEEGTQCLFCKEHYLKGQVLKIEQDFFDAQAAMNHHIKVEHGSVMSALLSYGSGITGLSETQEKLVGLMAMGLNDKDLASQMGVTPSTIRNHRFKLREKEKQARVFLAVMSLLNQADIRVKQTDKGDLLDPHVKAKSVDERYAITEKDKADVLKNFFTPEGALLTYPAKEKKKVIVLQVIANTLKVGRQYSEKELDTILKRVYHDHVSLRRALIEYGLMDRTNDGTSYWLRAGQV